MSTPCWRSLRNGVGVRVDKPEVSPPLRRARVGDGRRHKAGIWTVQPNEAVHPEGEAPCVRAAMEGENPTGTRKHMRWFLGACGLVWVLHGPTCATLAAPRAARARRRSPDPTLRRRMLQALDGLYGAPGLTRSPLVACVQSFRRPGPLQIHRTYTLDRPTADSTAHHTTDRQSTCPLSGRYLTLPPKAPDPFPLP